MKQTVNNQVHNKEEISEVLLLRRENIQLRNTLRDYDILLDLKDQILKACYYNSGSNHQQTLPPLLVTHHHLQNQLNAQALQNLLQNQTTLNFQNLSSMRQTHLSAREKPAPTTVGNTLGAGIFIQVPDSSNIKISESRRKHDAANQQNRGTVERVTISEAPNTLQLESALNLALQNQYAARESQARNVQLTVDQSFHKDSFVNSHRNQQAPANHSTISKQQPGRENLNQQKLSPLLDLLFEENTKLTEMMQRAMKDRDVAQAKILITEQIARASENEQNQMVELLNSSVSELQRENGRLARSYEEKLKNCQQTIKELEEKRKANGQDKKVAQPTIFVKMQEVLNPREPMFRLNQRLETMREMLTSLQEERDAINEKMQQLLSMNAVLLATLQQHSLVPDYRHGEIEKLDVYIQDQKKLIEIGSDGDSLEQGNIFSERVHKQNSQQLKPKKIPRVPQLNLFEAQRIMEYNVQKQLEQMRQKELDQIKKGLKDTSALEGVPQAAANAQQSLVAAAQPAGNNLNNTNVLPAGKQTLVGGAFPANPPATAVDLQQKLFEEKMLERIQQMENDLYRVRVFLNEELVTTAMLRGQLADAKRLNEELQERNSVLIKANQNLAEKYQKFYPAFQFYREYYYRLVNEPGNVFQQTAKPSLHVRKSNINTAAADAAQDLYFAPDSIARFLNRAGPTPMTTQQCNIDLEEVQDAFSERDVLYTQQPGAYRAQYANSVIEAQPGNARMNLLQIAFELYANTKVRNEVWRHVPQGSHPRNLLQGSDVGNSGWRLQRKGSMELLSVSEKPHIYALPLLRRLDKPIVRYLRRLEQKQQSIQHEKSMRRLKTPRTEIDEMDKFLQLEADNSGIMLPHMEENNFAAFQHSHYFLCETVPEEANESAQRQIYF